MCKDDGWETRGERKGEWGIGGVMLGLPVDAIMISFSATAWTGRRKWESRGGNQWPTSLPVRPSANTPPVRNIPTACVCMCVSLFSFLFLLFS